MNDISRPSRSVPPDPTAATACEPLSSANGNAVAPESASGPEEAIDWDVRIDSPPRGEARAIVVRFEHASCRAPKISEEPRD